MKVGIVGYGVLGHALERMLKKGKHVVCIYDKYDPSRNAEGQRLAINECDLTFIAVPTNEIETTGCCDLSQVEDCVRWIESPMCIKSTILPGTVDRLTMTFNKLIAFIPEYLGEQPNHPWAEIDSPGFMIVGGVPEIQELVVNVMASCLPPHVGIYRTDARAAELCKYMENCFLATKVAFVNQFHEIAQAMGVEFDKLRQLWLLDQRIGESHTRVTAEKGFGGRCLPKDLHAMIAAMRDKGGVPLLEAVSSYNQKIRFSAAKMAKSNSILGGLAASSVPSSTRR